MAVAGFKKTDAGEVPQDWQVLPMSAITSPSRPISYGIVQTGPQVHGGVPCLRVVDIANGQINTSKLITTSAEISAAYSRTVLQENDLVMPLRGKVGDVGMISRELVGSNLTRGVALIAIQPDWSARFCKQAISSPISRARLEQSMNGSALQEIPIAVLRSFKLAVPPTKAEQEAIAEALSDADALIESLEQLVAKKRQVKQGVMQELLTGKTRLPGFKREWRQIVIGEHVRFLRRGTHSRAVQRNDGPVINVHYGDVHAATQPRLDGRELSSLPTLTYQQAAGLDPLLDGDLVFADASEDLDGVGKAVEIMGLKGRTAVAGTHTIAARLDEAVFADGFKGYIQYVPEYMAQIRRLAAGTKVYGLTRSHVASVTLPVPPIEEQRAIADVLWTMVEEIETLETRVRKARLLKHGMMQELLTGRIRLV